MSCIGAVHPSFIDWRLRRYAVANSSADSGVAVKRLGDLPRRADGAIDGARLRAAMDDPATATDARAAAAAVLLIHLDAGETLPRIAEVDAVASARASSLFTGACSAHSAIYLADADEHARNVSEAAVAEGISRVGARMRRAAAAKKVRATRDHEARSTPLPRMLKSISRRV